jgi:large conductance mechanosensitive channel
MYGNFIGATINFLIIAFIMFMVMKGMNAMKKAEPAPAPAGPTATEALLAEIRDSLKK